MMWKILKNNFNLQSTYFRYALRLSLACTLVVMLYKTWNFPNGYWAAFSVVACVFPTQGQSLLRAKERVVGTFIGMWFGILLAHTLGSHIFLIDIAIAVLIFLAYYLKNYNYALFALFATVMTVLFICLIQPGDWQVALIRLEMTLFGAVIAILFTLFVLPVKSSHSLGIRKKEILSNLNQFYLNVIQENTAYLLPHQIELIKHLQTTLSLVKESRSEFGWKTPNKDEYDNLESIYHSILQIKTNLPSVTPQVTDLQPIWENLIRLFPAISSLFNDYSTQAVMRISGSLSQLGQAILQQRTIAAHQLSIPTATFYEHMQLSLLIQSLQSLLEALKKFNTRAENKEI